MLECTGCKFLFDNSTFLLIHLQNLCEEEFHKLSDFVCPICLLKLQGCDIFLNHLSQHGQIVENPIEVIESDTVRTQRPQTSRSNNRRPVQNAPKPFKCTECPASFSTKSNAKQHLLTHSREDSSTFNCSVCLKSFLSRSALKLHFRVHSNFCPFKCEYFGCSENFRTKKLMKTHIKREHFGITTTNKRHYSTFEAQRVIQKLTELTSKKTINEEIPLKKSANSAFSSLPIRRQHEPTIDRQRHLGRASLDISQFPPVYYNANCMQIQPANNMMPVRRSADFLFPNIYGYRNN